MGDALTASGTTQDVLGAVLGKSQPNISAMVTGGDRTRNLNCDNLEQMRDDATTHEAWLEFMRRHVGPGYEIRPVPVSDFELTPAKVISIARDMNRFERNLLAWPSDQSPQQRSFLLSGGRLVLRGVGELVNGMEAKPMRRSRR